MHIHENLFTCLNINRSNMHRRLKKKNHIQPVDCYENKNIKNIQYYFQSFIPSIKYQISVFYLIQKKPVNK